MSAIKSTFCIRNSSSTLPYGLDAYILSGSILSLKINVHVTQNAQIISIYWYFRELLMDFRGH